MNIADLFEEGKTIFSFEVFPPKKESGIETVYDTIEKLTDLKPDFISVTYGAGGSGVTNPITKDICSKIKNEYKLETIAHLSCINNTKDEIDKILEELKKEGIDNILALRGDRVEGLEPKKDFTYASDLTKYIMDKGGFHVSGACYPEVHMEAKDAVDDIKNLKKKVDAGADHLISQLFFDNRVFYDFLERARIADINVPIEAGIMPVTSKSQIERMVTMCGASIPASLSRIMQRYESNPEALRDAGIAYAINQIIDLTANGVDGVHIYTMNNPYVARKITEGVESVVKHNR